MKMDDVQEFHPHEAKGGAPDTALLPTTLRDASLSLCRPSGGVRCEVREVGQT